MRRATHGGVTLPVSLDARGATREPIQLAGRLPLRPVNSVARSRGKKDRASLSSRSALKLSQFAQTMLDIASILLIAAFVLLLFASPFIALSCLLFF